MLDHKEAIPCSCLGFCETLERPMDPGQMEFLIADYQLLLRSGRQECFELPARTEQLTFMDSGNLKCLSIRVESGSETLLSVHDVSRSPAIQRLHVRREELRIYLENYSREPLDVGFKVGYWSAGEDAC